MIRQLRLQRFKCFADLTLPLRNLTILTGLNSGGKTSVLQALLLLRLAHQAAETVALNGGPFRLQLGEALDISHRASGDPIDLSLQSTEGGEQHWRFAVPDDRALHLRIVARPGHAFAGALFGPTSRFTYLCAERQGPRDSLPADSADPTELSVGSCGEYTAQVLALRERAGVAPGRHLAATAADDLPALGLLRPQTEAWLAAILGYPGLQVQADWFPGTTVTRLRFKMTRAMAEWTRPPNIGFGVSYVLPILVAGLLLPADGLLIVENPEAHLHPAGQSAMGAFLAQVAGDGVQVLVETHSDHVVNGLRRAIVEGRSRLPAEEALIQFFPGGTGAGGRELHPHLIELSQAGDLSGWPPGFFDQLEQDLGALARSRRRGR